MNYSYPYAPQTGGQTARPRFLSLLIGFAFAFVCGILLGLLASFFYALIGQKGGIECLTVPIVIVLSAGSAVIAFFATRWIDKKIDRVR